MLKNIRRISAAFLFIFITLLFLDISGSLHRWFGWLAKIQFWPAVLALNVGVIIALVLLTLLFGRIYCSVICPLGVFQDIIAALRRKKNRYAYSPEKRWLRYGVLVVFLVCCFAGINIVVSLLDPYSSYGRFVTHLFGPLYAAGNNLLASIAEHFNSYAFYSADVWLKSLPAVVVSAVIVLAVSLLAWLGGRTYCNTICPVGTMLSLLARFSLFRITFDKDKCRKCGKCSRNCKAACIDFKNMSVDYSRCVACGNCLEHCNFDALHYCVPLKKRAVSTVSDDTVDKGKRSFLLWLGAATAMTTFSQTKKKVDGGLAAIEEKKEPTRATKITPPGSVSARHFAQHCTACQLCISECPNGVLRPDNGLENFLQPRMSYERGFYRPECHRCSEVCPTGAIQPITLEEKSSTQLGHAVWLKDNCIPVRDGVSCGNCERHCPTGAIEMVPLDEDDENSPLIPTVNEIRCIGCGACENVCPARPFPAIYIEGYEVHHLN